MKYNIQITETLSRIISIDSEILEEALEKVQESYDLCDIFLDRNDYVSGSGTVTAFPDGGERPDTLRERFSEEA